MKTDELIRALAADTVRKAPSARTLLVAVLAGGSVSLVGLLALMGVREDVVPALATWRFDVKLAVLAALLAGALLNALRLTRPTAGARPALYALPAGLLLGAVGLELVLLPSSAWRESLVGTNSGLCLAAIPALSLPPLAAVLVAMRRGAPRMPCAAGACAGCLAASIGGLLYGLHCFDDSPLFVATWYTLATLPIVAIGAVSGRLFLRW